ncbi:MAG TPA: hypothetical protein VGK67_30490 [Myxococcales bacterium]|jgi:hypothetical protein
MDSVLIDLVALAAVGAFTVFLGWYNARAAARDAAREAAWTSAAKSLGLKYVQGEGRTLAGRTDGFDVLLETFNDGSEQSPRPVTRVVVGGRGRIRPELAFKAEAAFEGLRKALGKDDLQLNDPEFDKAVNIHGPEDLALAALGAEARKLLPGFVRGGGTVHDGEVVLQLNGELNEAAALEGAVTSALAIARALAVDSVPAALLTNASKDPSPGVRRLNLAALAEKHAASGEARRGLEAGLADPDVEVRLLAARHLEASVAVQQVLEKIADDASTVEAARASALDRMAEIFPYSVVAPFVARSLAKDAGAARQAAAIRAAGKAKDAAQLETLLAMTGAQGLGLGVELAKAFAEFEGAQAEKGLIALLGHPEPAVRRLAAVGLSKVGSVKAVEPLLPLAEGVLAASEVKDAARDAVRAIQARLGDAGAGRLSVVDERAGEGGLSVESPDLRQRSGQGN